MTSIEPPPWAVGDDADSPGLQEGAFDLDDHDDDRDEHDDEEHLVRFSGPWWTRALSRDPLTQGPGKVANTGCDLRL